MLRNQLKALRRVWQLDRQRQRDLDQVRRGGVLGKSKKLYGLKVLTVDGVDHVDQDVWGPAVCEHFGRKWGIDRVQSCQELLNFITPHEGNPIPLTPCIVTEAFEKLAHRDRIDENGVSVSSLHMVFGARPACVLQMLLDLISSTNSMSQFDIRALVFGKASSKSPLEELRAILPLPALMQALDAVLLVYFSPIVDRIFPRLDGIFVGAQPHTQCLDISHGLQAVIEKGLDLEGMAAVGQQDIASFYDSLPMLLVAQRLVHAGVPASAVSCLLRHQVCPSVSVQFGAVRCCISGRCMGGLTGSRVAGLIGRIPVEDMLTTRRSDWLQWRFKLDGGRALLAASWVDNVYAASSTI